MDLALYCNSLSLLRFLKPNLKKGLLDSASKTNSPKDLEKKCLYQAEQATSRLMEKGRLQLKRIYYGSEFCTRLAPSIENISQAYELAIELGLGFTLVTGLQSEGLLSKTLVSVDWLAGQGDDCEVVVNDYGLLSMLDDYSENLGLLAGRLLLKYKRIPRFSERPITPSLEPDEPDHTAEILRRQMDYLQNDYYGADFYVEFFKKLGLKGLEMDILPQGSLIQSRPGLRRSFSYPWTYITSGRACVLAAEIDGHMSSKVIETCTYACKHSYIIPEFDFETWPLIQCGNAVLMFNLKKFSDYLENPLFDRAVFQYQLI